MTKRAAVVPNMMRFPDPRRRHAPAVRVRIAAAADKPEPLGRSPEFSACPEANFASVGDWFSAAPAGKWAALPLALDGDILALA
jgi:hypothetical protein